MPTKPLIVIEDDVASWQVSLERLFHGSHLFNLLKNHYMPETNCVFRFNRTNIVCLSKEINYFVLKGIAGFWSLLTNRENLALPDFHWLTKHLSQLLTRIYSCVLDFEAQASNSCNLYDPISVDS
jgi:hypothetical protein